MAKSLTVSAIERIKAGPAKVEIRDGTTGLILLVQASGVKSWIMRFRRPNGKHANLTLGRYDPNIEEADKPTIGQPLTLGMARVLAAEVRRQRALDIDVVANVRVEKHQRRSSYQGRDTNLFGQAVRDFIEGHHAKKTDRRPRDWRENARMLGLDFPRAGGEPTVVKNGLCDRWRDKPVVKISGDDIFHLVQEAKKDGIPGLGKYNDGVSKSRGRKMESALGGLFRWLHRHRRITTNPCFGMARQEPPQSRDRVLNVKTDVRNADELRWLWAAAEEVARPFGEIVKLLLLTGCRLNEIARVTKAELSDDLATLRLPGSRTKNGRPHDVPLPPLARSIVRGLQKHDGPFVFSTTNGHSPFSGFSKAKKSIDAIMLAKAKLANIEPWTLHDLRRTAATGMAGIGIPPHIIETLLNHVSGAKSGVAGTYNRETYESEKRAALEKWAGHVAAIVKVAKLRRGKP